MNMRQLKINLVDSRICQVWVIVFNSKSAGIFIKKTEILQYRLITVRSVMILLKNT